MASRPGPTIWLSAVGPLSESDICRSHCITWKNKYRQCPFHVACWRYMRFQAYTGLKHHVALHLARWLCRWATIQDGFPVIQLSNHYNTTSATARNWRGNSCVMDRQQEMVPVDAEGEGFLISANHKDLRAIQRHSLRSKGTLSSSSFLCIMGEVDPSAPSGLLHLLPTSWTT